VRDRSTEVVTKLDRNAMITNLSGSTTIALLLGSNYLHQPRPLAGAINDVSRMHDLMPPGAKVMRCVGSGLTRRALLRKLAKLRRLAKPRMIVILAFSGHGGRAHLRFRDGRLSEQPHGVLVTNDGYVVDTELSVAVAEIAKITPYVFVLLDCCFSQGNVRGELESLDDSLEFAGRRCKSVNAKVLDCATHFDHDYPEYGGFEGWLDQQRVRDVLDPDGHPDVLRVYASSPEQVAYEVYDKAGRAGGEMMIALHELRDQLGSISWALCGAQLRAAITARGLHDQRPEVEGPIGRIGFTRRSEDVSFNLVHEVDQYGHWLLGGRLHGVEIGDEFAIREGGRAHVVHVVDVLDDRARIEGPTLAGLRSGLLAYPRERADKQPVELGNGLANDMLLQSLITSATGVRPPRLGERPWATILDHSGKLGVHLSSDRLQMISSRERLLADLDDLARADRFQRALTSVPGLPPEFAWSHRVVRVLETGEQDLLAGDQVDVGDRLWLEFVNHSACDGQQLYFHVVELRVSGQLALLNYRHQPAGLLVPAGARRRVFWRDGAKPGCLQSWPGNVPDHEPRLVSWFFIASLQPLDLRSLAGVIEHEVATTRDSDETPCAHDFRWSCRSLEFTLVSR
jgi:hypothetical protein